MYGEHASTHSVRGGGPIFQWRPAMKKYVIILLLSIPLSLYPGFVRYNEERKVNVDYGSITNYVKSLNKDELIKYAIWGVVYEPFNYIESPVEIIGAYENIRIADPGHSAYGYLIKLWKDSNGYFGMFNTYPGRIADPPRGMLENVCYNSNTGGIYFQVRLSSGVMMINKKQVRSQDVFQFRGYLRKDYLKGELLEWNALYPEKKPKKKNIKLKKSDKTIHRLSLPKSYKQWYQKQMEILKSFQMIWWEKNK